MIAITKRFLLLSPLALLARKAFAAASGEPQDLGPEPPVVAVTPPPLTPAALDAVTKRAVEGYILPAYQDLAAATSKLVTAVNAVAPTAPGAPDEATRAAFAAVVAAFAKVDFLRFGPMAEEGRLEKFSYYPDRHGTGARQLRRMLATPDPAQLAPGAVAKLSAAVQGLPALESLIFAADSDSETRAYRWSLAAAIAGNLDTIAHNTLDGWTKTGGWQALMEQPGGSNIVYRDSEEPVIEILKAITTGLLQIRDQRMLPALGENFAAAKPNRAAFVASGNALAYLAASGAAIEDIARTSDLFSLTPTEAPKLGAESSAGFAAYRAGLAASATWQQAFADAANYKHLRDAFDALKTLEDLYSFRFPSEAGISPGFNALDGD
ncbi:hypothetical protein SAMN02745157_1699 [Kaistia soli DSM 19436]|uniref:Imelysin-like domain-containing protein n=1 Tax=Kaistia soli DSM 19436 TaxID=1122133 RepID=A0A1M4Z368_9HYPH|nr:imelysin family protein [Kaistia soli]SHF12405.1 hypothetical protein SAMN02745157_1699 [Kaistia soli DSM 19436]